jgi:hypothetical protein
VAALFEIYSFACEKFKLFCKVLRFNVQNDLILTSKPPRVAVEPLGPFPPTREV